MFSVLVNGNVDDWVVFTTDNLSVATGAFWKSQVGSAASIITVQQTALMFKYSVELVKKWGCDHVSDCNTHSREKIGAAYV